jgi:hypothetical protein
MTTKALADDDRGSAGVTTATRAAPAEYWDCAPPVLTIGELVCALTSAAISVSDADKPRVRVLIAIEVGARGSMSGEARTVATREGP